MDDPLSWLASGAGVGAVTLLLAQAWRQRRWARRPLALDAVRYPAVIESAPDALITIDEQQRIVLFNPAAERLLGCPAGEALGSTLSRFLPPQVRDTHARWITEFGRAGEVNKSMSNGREIEAVRADGTPVAAEAAIARLIDPLWPGGAQLYTVVLRDISQRKAAQAQLMRVQERYRRMVEQSPDAICLTEGDRIAVVNRTCLLLLGASDEGQVMGKDPHLFFDGAWDPLLHDTVALAGAPLRREGQLTRVYGTLVSVEISAASVPDHGHAALQLVMRDITERQRANAALQHQRDELGQHLTAVRIELAALGRDSDATVRTRLADLMTRVDTIVTSVRRIAADLRPAMLDDLGLEAALEWLINDWASRGHIAIHHQLDPLGVDLNDAAKTAVYRIVQEALTNVSRHARASEVQVVLRRADGALHIVVEDDGVGLAPDAASKRHSHGLRGIRERARALGGRAEMTDRTPRGCRLSVQLPLDRVDASLGDLQEPCA